MDGTNGPPPGKYHEQALPQPHVHHIRLTTTRRVCISRRPNRDIGAMNPEEIGHGFAARSEIRRRYRHCLTDDITLSVLYAKGGKISTNDSILNLRRE